MKTKYPFLGTAFPAFLLFAWVLLAPESGATEPGSPAVEALSKITVLLLPALDITPDAANMLSPRRAVIRHRQQAEFIKRQFKLAGESLATKAADRSPQLDLDHASARTSSQFDELASRSNTDWVVSLVVENVDMNNSEGSQLKARTRVLLQVWDARRHVWKANTSFSADASGEGSPAMVFMHSLDEATKAALSGILVGYPPVVALEDENGSLIDYLQGQTEPFQAEASKVSAIATHTD